MSQPPGKEGVSKKASKKMDPVEKCKRANPNDNAFCSMPDWKTCAPKDNTKRKDCSKLDDCEGKEGGKMKQQSARKLLGSGLAKNRCKRRRSKECLECQKDEECLPCHGQSKEEVNEDEIAAKSDAFAKCAPPKSSK